MKTLDIPEQHRTPKMKIDVISVVLPCLNEESTVAVCVNKAQSAIKKLGYQAEVIIADNGSTDDSIQRATDAGAVIVKESEKGYGYALRAGIDASSGSIIVMADADNTYDLSELSEFLNPIIEGKADFVIGNRFANITKGAMPFLHRYLGNPVLSFLLRLFFSCKVRDAHCGMRAFSREAYKEMNLVTTGMEFASEMVFRASILKLRMGEVDITYHLREGMSKLRTFRDGWRHLRLMLLYSPDFLFLLPAFFLWVSGTLIVLIFSFGPIHIGHRIFDLHTMLVGAVANITGLQLGGFGLIAKAYAHFTGLRSDPLVGKWSGRIHLEHGLVLGLLMGCVGVLFVGHVGLDWSRNHFGNLAKIRELILGLVILSNAIMVTATSFIFSIMTIRHKTKKTSSQREKGSLV
jgi:glycosyltransferase involved in cell wall biosynthesis